MTKAKNLGIWMDHSNAHIIEFLDETAEAKTLDSDLTQKEDGQSVGKNENVAHNREQHQQVEYYKNLAAVILNYDNVLLFGPTDAKAELRNMLKEDHHFDKINIEVLGADKMTEGQQHAFVKAHFSTN